jgi:tyrosine decarboxylase/aspartate 1-decarboxylase
MTLIDQKKRHNILQELQDYKNIDFSFSNGHILGSMCAQPHPIAKEAYIEFLETNLGDPELFPGTKKIELHLIQFIKELFHAPKSASGQIVSGGTEGNMTAMWIAKKLSKNKEIILPETAHFSFQKLASLMDMKICQVPLTKAYTIDSTKVKTKITKKTAAILGIAGSTELGTIDPIPELSDICYDEHIFLHVDAAFGGYILPFLTENNHDIPKFDFKLPGVSTISVDSHKMGYSAIPLGTLIIRNGEWLDQISVDTPYISVKKHSGFLGTRSGGPVAAAYAVARYLGLDGYKKVVHHCMKTTKYTKEKLEEMGLSLLIQPPLNVLGVKLSKPEKVAKKLSDCGWKVNTMNHLSCIRIVLMPQITKNVIDEFLPILKKTCKEVGEL